MMKKLTRSRGEKCVWGLQRNRTYGAYVSYGRLTRAHTD